MRSLTGILGILLCLAVQADVSQNKLAQEIFSEIYANKVWGENCEGIGWSGEGSDDQVTIIYREFLQNFIEKNSIKSVVDLGCGDWEFTRFMNWDGVDYKGYDVVASVIVRNKSRFEKENIHFFQADALNSELPVADLLVCKDVLQHLTNADIFRVMKQFHKYKYILITNGLDASTLSSDNYDIGRGDYRPLDLSKPPFNARGEKVLTFNSYYFIKQTFLIMN